MIKKSSFRKRSNTKYKNMEKISKLIEKETGHGEDVCDAILLGRSEIMKGIQNEKNNTSDNVNVNNSSNSKKLSKIK